METNPKQHSPDLLSAHDFDQIRGMLYRACGISLQPGKRALVSSRLEKLVRRGNYHSFRDYIASLNGRSSGAEFADLIDTLTTNHSGFWREPEHFQYLRSSDVLRRRQLRIWSAACAAGQEPYTISMCLLESAVPDGQIRASDISRTALMEAARGVYDSSKLQDLPSGWGARYFEPAGDSAGISRRVKPVVRSLVRFGHLNLLRPFDHVGLFDVIFCRNVMIYFDQITRDCLIERLVERLLPGGVLFTGHSETLLQFPSALRYVQPATYRKA